MYFNRAWFLLYGGWRSGSRARMRARATRMYEVTAGSTTRVGRIFCGSSVSSYCPRFTNYNYLGYCGLLGHPVNPLHHPSAHLSQPVTSCDDDNDARRWQARLILMGDNCLDHMCFYWIIYKISSNSIINTEKYNLLKPLKPLSRRGVFQELANVYPDPYPCYPYPSTTRVCHTPANHSWQLSLEMCLTHWV